MTVPNTHLDALRETLAEHAKWLRGEGTGTRANLARADLACANLACANLARADLACADLTGADLTGADLTGANLTGANLACANLACADLAGANLAGAYLTRANLTRANLTGANLTGANLTGANLTGANLTGGKFLARASVQFSAHGECGRELSAIKTDVEENSIALYCGCFTGTPEELRRYIKLGKDKYARTRTLALDTVLMLLEIQAVKS